MPVPGNFMQRATKQRFFAAFLCFLTVAVPLVHAKSTRHVAQENKESQLKAVQEHIAKVSKSIQADAEKRDSLVGELKSADENIQSAREQLADIRAQRMAAERQLNELQTESRKTEKQIADERDALAGEIRLAYMNGNSAQLKLLLNQQDPAQLGRMLGYYGYFSRARAQRIEAINDHLGHLAMLTDNIQQQSTKLRAIENDQARSVSMLAKAREKRATTLRQVETKLKNGNERLAKLQADAKSLERLIEELRRAAEARERENGSRRTVTGHGHWPWPVKGELIARYGQTRAGGLKWQGLMIAAPEGTQVHAPAAGRVLYSDWLPGLGLLLVLDHGNGIMSLYGHNEQLYKKQGEEVNAGDVLAAVGDSGVGGRSGLYLEIRDGKRPVDPLGWLGRP
ncbi:MAG: peptidoglycan DD-metalloendopeptidase family protein [Steroidobacter sp.]